MKIHELPSQDMETPTNEALKRFEDLVNEIEGISPPSLSPQSVQQLRMCLESVAESEFSEEQRLNAWRLSYRLWNTSVDIVNNLAGDQELTETDAELRQIASDLLVLAGAIGNARSRFTRIAIILFKTGCAWHKLRKFLQASASFEKAFELCFKQEEWTSQTSATREQIDFFFDLFLARARTAWELGGQTLACSLLGRGRGLLASVPAERHAELAEQYLHFGKSLLMKDDTDSHTESVRYMEIALDICSEALSISQLNEDNKANLERLKQRILRNLAAGHLQNENYEGALRCVDALRLATDQTSTSYFALRALAKLGRHDEVERELITLVSHSGEQFDVYISALEIVIEECGRIDVVDKAFFILLEHFGPDREQLPSKVLQKLLRQEPTDDPKCIRRVELALKIACNENIQTALMAGNEVLVLDDRRKKITQNQHQNVHTLLWARLFHTHRNTLAIRICLGSHLRSTRKCPNYWTKNCALTSIQLSRLCCSGIL